VAVQNNSTGFNLGGNGERLILPSPPRSLILPEHGLQSQGLVTHVGDEQALIIQEAKATNKTTPEPYFQVNGIFVPGNTETAGVIELVQAGDANIRYGQQEKPSFSFEEVLHNDLGKIIKLEADNTSIEDIKAYFGRLEGLSQPYKKDRGILMHNKASLAPLVMNRETFKEETYYPLMNCETFKEETYYPLKEFSLNLNSLEQLENIVLKSLKVEDESKSSSAKRFALKFLTNTVFIENFKSEKINQAVVQALKTDKEPAAKKIYEHYLTTQLGNLEPSQKEEIINALNENSRLSSHLAQSLFSSEPSLKATVLTEEFLPVNNFDDLEKILQNLHVYSKLAMNQVILLPSLINPDANYGIEIEMKLAGENNYRDPNSHIQKLLEPFSNFIELGTDFGGMIAEMRTGNGGFKLDEENFTKLFKILNSLHESPDLMLFLSQHIHVDKESTIYPSDALLALESNSNGVTLETKSLDLDTMQLNSNNNLVYSCQVPNLIDQMIILEELKNTKPSPEAILKSFQLNDEYKISLSMAQVMLTAIENGKYYLIPNLLRLNSQGKNYLETNYFAENEREDLIFKMIDINRKDIVEFIISKDAHALTQTNQQGSNLLMYAINKDDKEIVELLLNKIPEANLGEVLTCVDRYYHRNALMIALFNNNEEMAKLIMSKIPEAKLEEALTRVDTNDRNALMIALFKVKNDKEIVELLLNKIPEANLGEVLTCVDRYYHRNALMIALFNNNEEMAKLIMSKIPEAKLEEALTCVDEGGRNALMLAVDQGDEQIAQILKSKYEALNLTPTP
jgi:hypothetical protein